MQYQRTLRRYSLVLFFILAFALVSLVWQVFDLPNEQELTTLVEQYFLEYGLIIVFAGALIEAFMMLGWYVPGGTVVFLGVIFAAEDPPRALLTIAVAALGVFIGYTLNYFLGRYGFHRLFIRFGLGDSLKDARRRLRKQELVAMLASYWQPGLASIMSTAAGMIQMPVRLFLIYSTIAVVFWAVFWGAVAFFFGQIVVETVGLRLLLIILLAWVVAFLVLQNIREQRNNEE